MTPAPKLPAPALNLVTPEIAPHSQDAEEAVLGSVLINPNAFHEVTGFLKSGDFFILRNGWIWEAMERLAKRNEVIEYLTVINELRAQTRLDDIGGIAYITYLTSSTATSLNAEAYGRIVERAAIRRRMLEAAQEIMRLARDEEMDITEVVDKAHGTVEGVLTGVSSENVETSTDKMLELFTATRELREGTRQSNAVPTGTVLDRHLRGRGLRPGLWVITADTSGFKSGFMTIVATNMLLQKKVIKLNTLEMTTLDVLNRIQARLAGIGDDTLDSDTKLSVQQQADLKNAQDKMLGFGEQLFIDDTEDITALQYARQLVKAKREHKIQAAFLDYLELLNLEGVGKDTDKHYQQLGNAARLFKKLSHRLEIPVIILVQQNRTGGQDGVKGIAGSYDIVKHADGVLHIKDKEEAKDGDIVVTKTIHIAKQRGGQRRSVEVEVNLATKTIIDRGE
jgi:replicative DNA helicase